MNFFEKINNWIHGTESSIVNFVSAVAPWLAPIAPAYMTYIHAVGEALDFPPLVALSIAVVVEILGFSAVSTLIAFWFFNRRNKALAKKAPIGWIVFAFMFYLVLIITSNVLLDATNNSNNAVIAVRALYTLQTIPAALIVIARVGHKDLIAEIENERTASKANSSANGSQDVRKEPERQANGSRTFASLSRTEKYHIVNNDSKIVASDLGVTPRAIQKWRIKIQEEIQTGKL